MTRFHNNGGRSALLVLALGAVIGAASDAATGPASDFTTVKHTHDDATRFAQRMLLQTTGDDTVLVDDDAWSTALGLGSSSIALEQLCYVAAWENLDDKQGCPTGTYRNKETKEACGENRCVPCYQCLRPTDPLEDNTLAQLIVLTNTTLSKMMNMDLTLRTTFGKDRYWADVCYPDNSWRTAGECHCKGLWMGDTCDERGNPAITFIVSSMMLVVCTALVLVCICFRAEMRSSKWANHYACMPMMKNASTLSLAFQV
jgi:hypothetical protein